MSRIAYLVHNLADAAVVRRIRMLQAAGAEVVVAGFCRDANPPATIAGAQAIMLGQTHDAALAQRAVQVGANLLHFDAIARACRGADVIIARNLEMLVLGSAARRRLGVRRLVYESLDIHSSLLGSGFKNRIMRAIERAMASRCDLLLYSSPAFRREYFRPVQQIGIPGLLVENKLLDLDGSLSEPAAQIAPAPPWRIGWFGNLRCKRTLALLTEAAAQADGRLEIIVAGKASPAEFPDFASQVQRPHVRYLGPYTPADLPALYGRCHFAWAIDYFEEGRNSTWLLPNRLYEAGAYGVVPIALGTVETGRWLSEHSAGLLLEPGEETAMLARLATKMDLEEYTSLQTAVRAIPRDHLVAGPSDCAQLLQAVAG